MILEKKVCHVMEHSKVGSLNGRLESSSFNRLFKKKFSTMEIKTWPSSDTLSFLMLHSDAGSSQPMFTGALKDLFSTGYCKIRIL